MVKGLNQPCVHGCGLLSITDITRARGPCGTTKEVWAPGKAPLRWVSCLSTQTWVPCFPPHLPVAQPGSAGAPPWTQAASGGSGKEGLGESISLPPLCGPEPGLCHAGPNWGFCLSFPTVGILAALNPSPRVWGPVYRLPTQPCASASGGISHQDLPVPGPSVSKAFLIEWDRLGSSAAHPYSCLCFQPGAVKCFPLNPLGRVREARSCLGAGLT